ncbi:MAG: hypothetical protein V7L20_28125 [Nostoc sp.]|uniref:hypothetical protein n=1 Tax=Nostoc sp. TaxID=1180 RepID=UPI002FF63AD2
MLSNWLSKEDPKFFYWIEKLLLEEYKGNDQNLIIGLTQKINARSDGSASHRYILDLSMATDLLVSHVPSQLQPVFVQLKGIPMLANFYTLTFSISLGRIHKPHLFPQNHGQYFWSSISH